MKTPQKSLEEDFFNKKRLLLHTHFTALAVNVCVGWDEGRGGQERGGEERGSFLLCNGGLHNGWIDKYVVNRMGWDG